MTFKTVSPGVTRVDVGARKGYMVRISRNGERVSRYFADADNGGKRKSLAIAKQTHEDLVNELGPPANTKGRVTSRNSSGIVGVHLAYTNDKRYAGCEYYAYCASWVSEEGKREKISFAFTKYGEDMAFELAKLAREKEITERDKVVAMYERSSAGRTKSSKKAVKKTAKKATAKKVKKSARKAVKKPVKKSVKKAAKKPVKKPVKKAVKKPVKKSVKKGTKKTARG